MLHPRLFALVAPLIAACANESSKTAPAPTSEAPAPVQVASPRVVIDTQAAAPLPQIPANTWQPLHRFYPPKGDRWMRIAAKSSSTTALALTGASYPNHHPCVQRTPDAWSIQWFRGEEPCQNADRALRLQNLSELHLYSEKPRPTSKPSALTIRWGDARHPVGALATAPQAEASQAQAQADEAKAPRRKKGGGETAPLADVLAKFGPLAHIHSIEVVDTSGAVHELRTTLLTQPNAPELKRNRKGEFSLRWTDASGAPVRLRGLREIRVHLSPPSEVRDPSPSKG